MTTLLRHALLLAIAGWLSWWFFLRVPPEAARSEAETVRAIEVVPLLRDPPPPPLATSVESRVVSAEPMDDAAEPASVSWAPEVGTPEGHEERGLAPAPEETEALLATPQDASTEDADVEDVSIEEREPLLDLGAEEADSGERAEPELAAAASEPLSPSAPDAQDAAPPRRDSIEARMQDPALLAAAREEFAHGNRKGFTTVLLSAPEDQLDIARFFGEELVLVPRTALDPEQTAPSWYRLSTDRSPRVERISGAPRLEGHRPYRDLFDYDYARLPTALRELRRALVSRDDVYLFAALLSAGEWAVVIARRAEALAESGRELDEVRRFVLRYVPLDGGAFDLRAEEIVFTDGTRFVPGNQTATGSTKG